MNRLDGTEPDNDRTSTDAEPSTWADEREHLIQTVRNLSHEALINRDIEFGLRAEIYRLEDQLLIAHHAASKAVEEVRGSTTWRVGRIVLKPLTLVRRASKGSDK
ncbi:hypothetical protein DCE94_06230 [Agromyces badenianii]|nr:hypothetical protein DCE94_06230 [Agromyces badenianii]